MTPPSGGSLRTRQVSRCRSRASTVAGILASVFLVAGIAAAQQKPAPRPNSVPSSKQPSAAAAKAQENYRATCVPCHGPDGKGIIPNSNLADGEWKHGSSTAAIAKIIRDGVKGTVMLPYKDRFTEAEILELARLVRSFGPPPKARKTPRK